MIGIPTMYWATLVAVIISFFLLWKVWVLTKLLQSKNKNIKTQMQYQDFWKEVARVRENKINRYWKLICDKNEHIKDLNDNIRHLREIKERREHD